MIPDQICIPGFEGALVIFKMTRAPSKPGIQFWSGIIAHPKGMVTFTKSIDIVDKI